MCADRASARPRRFLGVLGGAAFGAAIALVLIAGAAAVAGVGMLLLFPPFSLILLAAAAIGALAAALIAWGLGTARFGPMGAGVLAALLTIAQVGGVILYVTQLNAGHDTGPMFG